MKDIEKRSKDVCCDMCGKFISLSSNLMPGVLAKGGAIIADVDPLMFESKLFSTCKTVEYVKSKIVCSKDCASKAIKEMKPETLMLNGLVPENSNFDTYIDRNWDKTKEMWGVKEIAYKNPNILMEESQFPIKEDGLIFDKEKSNSFKKDKKVKK